MSKKGTLLKRRNHSPFVSGQLRGAELVRRMKVKWCKDHPGQRFSYKALSAALPPLADSGEPLSAQYLTAIASRDPRVSHQRAEIIAQYLGINKSDIACSCYASTRYLAKNLQKAQVAIAKKVVKQTTELNAFCSMATVFISKNNNLKAHQLGVGYVR